MYEGFRKEVQYYYSGFISYGNQCKTDYKYKTDNLNETYRRIKQVNLKKTKEENDRTK